MWIYNACSPIGYSLTLRLAKTGGGYYIWKILLSDEDSLDLKYLKVRRLIEYWGNQITTDPLYLLDAKSRQYFEIKTSSGSRRVELEEFEEDINEH